MNVPSFGDYSDVFNDVNDLNEITINTNNILIQHFGYLMYNIDIKIKALLSINPKLIKKLSYPAMIFDNDINKTAEIIINIERLKKLHNYINYLHHNIFEITHNIKIFDINYIQDSNIIIDVNDTNVFNIEIDLNELKNILPIPINNKSIYNSIGTDPIIIIENHVSIGTDPIISIENKISIGTDPIVIENHVSIGTDPIVIDNHISIGTDTMIFNTNDISIGTDMHIDDDIFTEIIEPNNKIELITIEPEKTDKEIIDNIISVISLEKQTIDSIIENNINDYAISIFNEFLKENVMTTIYNKLIKNQEVEIIDKTYDLNEHVDLGYNDDNKDITLWDLFDNQQYDGEHNKYHTIFKNKFINHFRKCYFDEFNLQPISNKFPFYIKIVHSSKNEIGIIKISKYNNDNIINIEPFIPSSPIPSNIYHSVVKPNVQKIIKDYAIKMASSLLEHTSINNLILELNKNEQIIKYIKYTDKIFENNIDESILFDSKLNDKKINNPYHLIFKREFINYLKNIYNQYYNNLNMPIYIKFYNNHSYGNICISSFKKH